MPSWVISPSCCEGQEALRAKVDKGALNPNSNLGPYLTPDPDPDPNPEPDPKRWSTDEACSRVPI